MYKIWKNEWWRNISILCGAIVMFGIVIVSIKMANDRIGNLKQRECKEETGYNVIPERFCGICEEICDNEETREFYSQYAHKLYHIYICKLANSEIDKPTSIDDMQEESQWIDIEELNNIRILPIALGENIYNMIKGNLVLDLGSTHIPYNHG